MYIARSGGSRRWYIVVGNTWKITSIKNVSLASHDNCMPYFLEFFLRVLLFIECANMRVQFEGGKIQGWVQLMS